MRIRHNIDTFWWLTGAMGERIQGNDYNEELIVGGPNRTHTKSMVAQSKFKFNWKKQKHFGYDEWHQINN